MGTLVANVIDVDQCDSCGRLRGERHKATQPRPSLEQLEEWTSEGQCEATDGCVVEPDGTCEHGHRSWLVVLGFI